MIYPEVKDFNEWLKRYGLDVFVYRCPKCEQDFKSTIPFLIKGYAGLETPFHGCSVQYREFIVTPTAEDTKLFWSKII